MASNVTQQLIHGFSHLLTSHSYLEEWSGLHPKENMPETDNIPIHGLAYW
jgi:hypothetical protein